MVGYFAYLFIKSLNFDFIALPSPEKDINRHQAFYYYLDTTRDTCIFLDDIYIGRHLVFLINGPQTMKSYYNDNEIDQ